MKGVGVGYTFVCFLQFLVIRCTDSHRNSTQRCNETFTLARISLVSLCL